MKLCRKCQFRFLRKLVCEHARKTSLKNPRKGFYVFFFRVVFFKVFLEFILKLELCTPFHSEIILVSLKIFSGFSERLKNIMELNQYLQTFSFVPFMTFFGPFQ